MLIQFTVMQKKLIVFLSLGIYLLTGCNTNENPVIQQAGIKTVAADNLSAADKMERQFKQDITHYINSYNDERWEDVYEMMDPLAKGQKTRDEVITSFIQSKLMGMQRRTELKGIEKISNIITKNNKQYCRIFFGATAKVKLGGKALEGKQYIQQNLELSYDTNDVQYDEATQTVTIPDAYQSMLAISEIGSNIWHYIEVDKQKEAAIAQMIGADVWDGISE